LLRSLQLYSLPAAAATARRSAACETASRQ